MGFLQGKSVYLSGGIHHTDNCINWRDELTPKLQRFGLTVIDPCKQTIKGFGEVGADKDYLKDLIKKGDFAKVKEKFFPLMKKDLRCVDLSHFMILMYSPLQRTVGTWHEAVLCGIEKKPILLYYPPEELNEFNPWVACLTKTNHIFSQWDKMLEYLQEVDNGNFDSSLWY